LKQEPESLPSVADAATDRSASKNGSEGRRSSISRNASFNILGSVLPMFVTLATVPPYLKLIGDVRFGVLSLVWVFLGYFGLFEMGLGRATSKYIAQLKNDAGETRESVFWTALLVNLAVGSVGGLLLWAVASVTMPFWLKAGGDIQAEVARSMPWLAAAVPVATLTSVLVGALEGREEFGAINSQQIGATVVFQLVPLGIAAWLGPRIDWLVAATVLTRVATNVPLFVFCVRRVPLRGMPRINREWVVRLWRFGIWITVSGIASPILTSLDRFVIGFAQGAQAVTYYAIPYGFASKLLVFPSSVSRALFPRFSAQQSSGATQMGVRAVLGLASILTPIVVMAIMATDPFFRLWIGPVAASRCVHAGELLLIGIWINALAYIPNGLLQAQGRPDLPAKFHVAEVLPFVAVLWVGTHFWGVTGAAAAWCIRAFGDAVLLFVATDILRATIVRLIPAIALTSFAFVTALLLGEHFLMRLLLFALLGVSSLLVSHATSPEAMQLVLSRARSFFGKNEFPATSETGA
jgi:O-antigen/teichoic acid export membrane protein